jgi:predicted ester cyclase
MSTPSLVTQFYSRIWNSGELTAIPELLVDDFVFRGSLGTELSGQTAFSNYVRSVSTSLLGYRCEILECVNEGDQAFAQMEFSGQHVGSFLGYAPTGNLVSWAGAALFRFSSDKIESIWVLGDLKGLESKLRANSLGRKR